MAKNMKNQTQSNYSADNCHNMENEQTQNSTQSKNKSSNKASNKAGTNKSSQNSYNETNSEY